jgi:hypothetical protein
MSIDRPARRAYAVIMIDVECERYYLQSECNLCISVIDGGTISSYERLEDTKILNVCVIHNYS